MHPSRPSAADAGSMQSRRLLQSCRARLPPSSVRAAEPPALRNRILAPAWDKGVVKILLADLERGFI